MSSKTTARKKILITGGSGLIGSYFLKCYSERFKDNDIIYPCRNEMDVIRIDTIKRCFEKYRPEIVVHLAAFRDASLAEKERGDKNGNVWKVNVEGTKYMARVCNQYKSFLIHISTDYIFSGHRKNPGPYEENAKFKDSDRLLSWYGLTKREAERVVLDNIKQTSIIRICNITWPGNEPKMDYIGKILQLYLDKKIYPLFDDQYLTLSYIPTLVKIIIKLLIIKLPGIYHVSTTDICTPHKIAEHLIERFSGVHHVIPSTSIKSYLNKYPRRYPQFGGLRTDITQKRLGIPFTTWQEVVNSYESNIKIKKLLLHGP